MKLHYVKLVNKENRSAEMLLYGEIGAEVNGHYFAQDLSYLSREYDSITIRINSIGGSIDQGLSIVSQMMSSTAYITAHVDGVAASMAAVILAAADKVTINDYAKVMVHSPYYVDENGDRAKNLTAKDKKALAMLKDTLTTLLKKRGIDDEAVNTMMRTDTWFNAEEAVSALLVDEVVVTARRKELAAVEPLRLVAMIKDEFSLKNKDNKMKNIIAKLGLPEESDEQAVEQAVTKLQAQSSAMTKMVDTLVAIGKKVGTITDKNEEAMKRLASTDLDLFVDLVDVESFGKDGQQNDGLRLSEVIARLNNLGVNSGGEEKDWDWYQKNDPAALREMKSKNSAEYTKLYKAYWGEEPK